MNPIIPGLKNEKMSSSEPSTTIDFLDQESAIKKKLAKAYFDAEKVEDSPIIHLIKNIVFNPRFADQVFHVPRDPKCGGESLDFHNVEDICKQCRQGDLHPADVKNALAIHIANLFKPVRDALDSNKEMQEILQKAYK